ncbi:MAG: dTDP-4-dehydrorhamnose reductase [Bacteroidales bacterium]|nr:dTDP-4-dehydrorhamnose reductase [Bacteroidales bacterium]
MAKDDTLKNILVTGANGQLGTSLALMANGEDARFFFTDVDTLDITDYRAVSRYMKANHIDIVINCAAYTNVDKAEDDREAAFKVNAEAPGILAKACRVNKASLIHISTDYVFGKERSTKPRTEEVKPSPSGVYGESKLAGEMRILEELPEGSSARYAIVRTAWLYSEYGRNFVKTMLGLFSTKDRVSVVFDQVGTPTYAGDLAAVVYRIAMEMACGQWRKIDNGIYNFTDEGVCSWYDFAQAVADESKSCCKVLPCHSDEFPSKVRRPAFSVLDKGKIKQRFQIEIPYWRESLRICLKTLLEQHDS